MRRMYRQLYKTIINSISLRTNKRYDIDEYKDSIDQLY
jgi:hypothetical protein